MRGRHFKNVKRIKDSKADIPNPCFGPATSFCQKVTYLKPVTGGHVCRDCGCYHEGEKK